jgi:glycerol-3-phosphate acyltransferase PlsY
MGWQLVVIGIISYLLGSINLSIIIRKGYEKN